MLSHFGQVVEKDSRALKGSFNINYKRYFPCNFLSFKRGIVLLIP